MKKTQLYIGGQWRDGRAGQAPAVSPASGETFALVAVADPADVDDAVAAAAAAGPDWAGWSPFGRAGWRDAVVAGIGRRRDELARALTEDQGKPLLAEAFDEVDELAGYFRMAGEDAKRSGGALPSFLLPPPYCKRMADTFPPVLEVAGSRKLPIPLLTALAILFQSC